jgi:prepilin-type N-terminal cleavage/methylation domain-containing protein
VTAPAARNDEARMSNVEGNDRMTNIEQVASARVRHSGFVINSSFVIRHSSFGITDGFTLIELIVVVAIIIILAGLVLSTVGYVQKKAARSRAETEIAAMSAALESYKADNGAYARGPATAMTVGSTIIPANVTDNLDAKTKGDPTNTTTPTYGQTSLYLYTQLSGDLAGKQQATSKSYFTFKPQMLTTDTNGYVTAIKDPFGNSYGYSTVQQTGTTTAGYNPTFDLWSTAGLTSGADSTQWIKNW